MRLLLLAAISSLPLFACQPTWSSSVKKQGPQVKKAPPPPPAMQGPTGKEGEIVELEDRRSYGDGRLALLALTDADAKVRARALLALGRIQDDASIDPLLKGLSDPDAGARGEAAFGIGLMGLAWQGLEDSSRSSLVKGLTAAETSETDIAVKLLMLEALGRLATEDTPQVMDLLTDRLAGDGDVQWRAAMSLGIAAKQGGKMPARAVTALAPMLKDTTPDSLRYAAAYALMRTKTPAVRQWMLLCTQDAVADIRATCAKGLGDVGTEVDGVTLGKMLNDPDTRVASEAARSLAKLSLKCKSSACVPLGALKGLSSRVAQLVAGHTAEGAHPLLAFTQEELPASAKPLLQSLRQQLLDGVRGVSDAQTKHDIANIECRIAAALDRQSGTITEVLNCGGGLIPEAQRLATGLREVAQSKAAGRHAPEFLAYLFHADPKVKLAALDALSKASTPSLVLDKVRLSLATDDPVVQAYSALTLAKLKDKQSAPQIRALAAKAMANPDIAPTVAEALSTLGVKDAAADLEPWLQSPAAVVRYAAADALTTLTGKPVRAPHVERPKSGTRPPMPPSQVKLAVQTERGDFELELFVHDAPLTSLNFYQLARKGFFKGLTFHRIVPDFVAQGGDPRGDGEGGPGYSIRCEVGHVPYARGVLGMALGGKDTGGSQFFITYAPQPHLDGRYTAFGRVTKGMEVVDALLEGDKIVDVRSLP